MQLRPPTHLLSTVVRARSSLETLGGSGHVCEALGDERCQLASVNAGTEDGEVRLGESGTAVRSCIFGCDGRGRAGEERGAKTALPVCRLGEDVEALVRAGAGRASQHDDRTRTGGARLWNCIVVLTKTWGMLDTCSYSPRMAGSTSSLNSCAANLDEASTSPRISTK